MLLRPPTRSVFLILMVLGNHALGEEDALRKLKSPDAKKALLIYERVLSKATEEFEEKVAPARKILLGRLATAQAKAIKANRLDDAVLIRDIRKRLVSDKEAIEPSSGARIIAAFYGQYVSWLDVTGKVRQAVKGKRRWSAVVSTKDWGEPALGFAGPRTLLIRYYARGKVMHKSAYEGKEITLP